MLHAVIEMVPNGVGCGSGDGSGDIGINVVVGGGGCGSSIQIVACGPVPGKWLWYKVVLFSCGSSSRSAIYYDLIKKS